MTAPEKTQGERKNPNNMTLDECRDELARNAGWEFKHNSWWHPTIQAMFHPIPATLDEAAKLPNWCLLKCVQIPRFKTTDVFMCVWRAK